MSNPFTHLTEIQLALVASSIVAEFQVIRAWSHTDDGYIRIRATLINGDFLESAEYFILDHEQITTVDYRHHWTNSDKSILRKRWDNTPDHPELPGFPHHIHVSTEDTVIPSLPVSIIELLTILEGEMN